MSIGVLILSIIFAGIEALASWLMLSFAPVATIFAGVPLWLITAIVFALGMLLSFVLILLVGGSQITDRAADFVRDHLGRALALMLASVILIFGLASGAESLYQLKWTGARVGKKEYVDICFMLDFSGSMRSWMNGSSDDPRERQDELKKAFADALDVLEDGQRISVVSYNTATHDSVADQHNYPTQVVFEWNELNAQTRAEAIAAVNAQNAYGDAGYDEAFDTAGRLIEEAAQAGRTAVAIMFSDGVNYFSGFDGDAEPFETYATKIYSVGFGDPSEFASLQEISDQTGGALLTSGTNVGDISRTLMETAQKINLENNITSRTTADTLLTAADPNHEVIIHNRMLMRILLLFILSFVFKLIVNICIGNNDSSVGVHILTAFIIALLGSLAVEFGYMLGLPLLAVESVYWLLLMCQIVITNR